VAAITSGQISPCGFSRQSSSVQYIFVVLFKFYRPILLLYYWGMGADEQVKAPSVP